MKFALLGVPISVLAIPVFALIAMLVFGWHPVVGQVGAFLGFICAISIQHVIDAWGIK